MGGWPGRRGARAATPTWLATPPLAPPTLQTDALKVLGTVVCSARVQGPWRVDDAGTQKLPNPCLGVNILACSWVNIFRASLLAPPPQSPLSASATPGRPERAPCCTTTRHAGDSTTTRSAPGCCTTDWPALCSVVRPLGPSQEGKVRANP